MFLRRGGCLKDRHAVEVVSSGCFRSRTSLSVSTDAIHNPSGYKGLAVIPVVMDAGNGIWCCTHVGSRIDFGFPVCATEARYEEAHYA